MTTSIDDRLMAELFQTSLQGCCQKAGWWCGGRPCAEGVFAAYLINLLLGSPDRSPRPAPLAPLTAPRTEPRGAFAHPHCSTLCSPFGANLAARPAAVGHPVLLTSQLRHPGPARRGLPHRECQRCVHSGVHDQIRADRAPPPRQPFS